MVKVYMFSSSGNNFGLVYIWIFIVKRGGSELCTDQEHQRHQNIKIVVVIKISLFMYLMIKIYVFTNTNILPNLLLLLS